MLAGEAFEGDRGRGLGGRVGEIGLQGGVRLNQIETLGRHTMLEAGACNQEARDAGFSRLTSQADCGVDVPVQALIQRGIRRVGGVRGQVDQHIAALQGLAQVGIQGCIDPDRLLCQGDAGLTARSAQCHDLMPGCHRLLHNMRADKAGRSGDEQLHDLLRR